MNLWLRLLAAVAIATLAGLVGFIAVFCVVGRFGSCPPEVHTCDLPMIAGFGLGLMAGPLAGIVAGAWTFRRLGRTRPHLVPPAT
jgi:hypothetical protein